jgi:hypothetical protein
MTTHTDQGLDHCCSYGQEHGKALSSGHSPQQGLLFGHLKNSRHTRGYPIEHTAIPMLPNHPRAQHHKGVEALLELARDPKTLHAPPIFEQLVVQLRRQCQHANRLQES